MCGSGPLVVSSNSQFGGLLFAPTVTLPCTCSSDRGWCGVGPLGCKYKPLYFHCLADKTCGGPAAPRFRHVPHMVVFLFFCWDLHLCRVTGSAARRHGQHPCTDAADKGSGWLVGWWNGFVRQHKEVFGRELSTRLFSLPDKTKKKACFMADL